MLGQTLLGKQISHMEGSSSEAFEITSKLQKGNYTLEISGPGKSAQSIKIIN
jgi:hypothetical protein